MRLPVLGATAIVLSVAVAWWVFPFEREVTGFFDLGDRWPLAPGLRGTDPLVREGAGYDGQFYLALALDPFLRDPGTLAALDNPRYRSSRSPQRSSRAGSGSEGGSASGCARSPLWPCWHSRGSRCSSTTGCTRACSRTCGSSRCRCPGARPTGRCCAGSWRSPRSRPSSTW